MIAEAKTLYFERFPYQPYPLLLPSLRDPPDDSAPLPLTIVLPMTALSIRLSNKYDKKRQLELQEEAREMAWRHICQHYVNFEFDETFFEGLCLLAQADFAGTIRACL